MHASATAAEGEFSAYRARKFRRAAAAGAYRCAMVTNNAATGSMHPQVPGAEAHTVASTREGAPTGKGRRPPFRAFD